MIRQLQLFVVTALLVAVAAITASSAAAGVPRPDRGKAFAHVIQIHRANVGLPPVIGGPYGDPSDFPGFSDPPVRSDSSSSESDTGSGDDCLHQIVQPHTAC